MHHAFILNGQTMNNSDDPKVAFVTGGAQGLGLGISKFLLMHGWKVTMFDIDQNAGDEAVQALSDEQQDRTLFFCGDVAKNPISNWPFSKPMTGLAALTGWSTMPVLPTRTWVRSNTLTGIDGSAC